MKSLLDDAKLRLSAAHPEMSHHERERAATRIAKGMTAVEIEEESILALRRYDEAQKLLRKAEVQLMLLVRAKEFQRQTEGH